MPVSIADFHRQSRTLTMESELGPVKWSYRPYRVTMARQAEIQRIMVELGQTMAALEAASAANDVGAMPTLLATVERSQEMMVEQFCEVVSATDMIGPLHAEIDPVTMEGIGEPFVPAGEPIPIRPETVRCFSYRYVQEVLEAIAADARPKETPTPTP